MLRRVKIAFLLATAAGCAARGPASTAPGIRDAPGTVQRVGDFGYGLVPDSDPGTRYAPDRLPSAFQVDGLRVVFSGEVLPPPANARLWATPLRLTAIRRAPPAQR
jgi:hypothetical protein